MYDSCDSHNGYEPQPLRIFLILTVGVFLYLVLAFGFSEARASERGKQGLLFKTLEKGKFLPAPLLGTDVDINVSGIVARVRIRQFYMNPTDKWLEGIYVFPMADKSAVDTLRLKIGDRIVVGEIKERGHARRIYEAAKKQGKKAALLESERPNVFTASVTNIGPRDSIVVELAYQETVTFKDGEFRLRFPMVVGPRYAPRKRGKLHLSGVETNEVGETDEARVLPPVLSPEMGNINPVNLTVRLGGTWPVSKIKSLHHPIIVESDKSGSVVIKLLRGPVPADQDFELTWPANDAVSRPILFTEDWNGEKFGLVMIAPPGTKHFAMPRLRRELIFVIDTSGSMAGESIRQAKASLLQTIEKLQPTDVFNIIRFSTLSSSLFGNVKTANEQNLDTARTYIRKLQAEGGTEMLPALKMALDGRWDRTRLRQIIFMTDGAVTNEQQLFHTITDRLGDARLFTVGIGSAPNQHFMRGAAKQGRGTFTFIGSPDQVEERMARLWDKLANPVVTHLSVKPVGYGSLDVWPKAIPDLFSGEPVVFAFKYGEDLEEIKVSGIGADGPWVHNLDIATAVPGQGIAKLWAREKIAGLESSVFQGKTPDQVRESVLDTALLYKLVTRYTSLVAVEKAQARPFKLPIVTMKMPTNWPRGRKRGRSKEFKGPDMDTAGFQQNLLKRARRHYKSAGPTLLASAKPLGVSPAQASAGTQTLQLPQTATLAEIYLLIGFVLFGTAFIVWRVGRWRGGRS